MTAFATLPEPERALIVNEAARMTYSHSNVTNSA